MNRNCHRKRNTNRQVLILKQKMIHNPVAKVRCKYLSLDGLVDDERGRRPWRISAAMNLPRQYSQFGFCNFIKLYHLRRFGFAQSCPAIGLVELPEKPVRTFILHICAPPPRHFLMGTQSTRRVQGWSPLHATPRFVGSQKLAKANLRDSEPQTRGRDWR